jgi:hypothetical protein
MIAKMFGKPHMLLSLSSFTKCLTLNWKYLGLGLWRLVNCDLHLNVGHRGCDRMGVGFTTTCAISAYHY